MHPFAAYSVLMILYAVLSVQCTAEPVINLNTKKFKVEAASFADYPFIVSIGRKGKVSQPFTYRQGHFCAGALITREHVLTAAHCMIGEKAKNLRVIVGMVQFNKTKSVYEVRKWKTFTKWARKLDSENDHDIAVIKLTKPVAECNVRPIEIYQPFLNKNVFKLETAGWGETEKYQTSPVLLKASLQLIPIKQCEKDLQRESNATQHIRMQHMCTRSPYNLRLGCGDSGGPLILRQNQVAYLVGVNEAYCGTSTSSINTHARVYYYRNFINSATNPRNSDLFCDVN